MSCRSGEFEGDTGDESREESAGLDHTVLGRKKASCHG